MSKDEIYRRVRTMGTLVLLDSPINIEIGIDNVVYVVGDKFRGIKMIPIGVHLLTYS